MSVASKKILVVGPAWVGDMVMAQTLFILLKSHDPNVIIDVMAPPWSVPLIERMPEIRAGIPLAINHSELKLATRWQMAQRLKAEAYDQAILLPNSFKSALIPWLASIPIRTGWRGEWRYGLVNDLRILNKEALPLMIQRFIALGLSKHSSIPETCPWPKLAVNTQCALQALTKFNLIKDERPILALCPGAEYGPAKRWPARYFAEVAAKKLADGQQIWIFGSAKDQIFAQEIQEHTQNRCVDLTGKTSLAEAIDLMSLTNTVISNDSGLMHIAAALQKKLIVLYGSSSPRFTPPLSHDVQILTLELPCSPCFKRECPLHHLDCLQKLTPPRVLTALENP